VVMGARDTICSTANGAVQLHSGSLLAVSGDKPVTVETPSGTVQLAPHTSVLIKSDKQSNLHVAVMSSEGSKEAVTVTTKDGGVTKASSNEQLQVGSTSTSESVAKKPLAVPESIKEQLSSAGSAPKQAAAIIQGLTEHNAPSSAGGFN